MPLSYLLIYTMTITKQTKQCKSNVNNKGIQNIVKIISGFSCLLLGIDQSGSGLASRRFPSVKNSDRKLPSKQHLQAV